MEISYFSFQFCKFLIDIKNLYFRLVYVRINFPQFILTVNRYTSSNGMFLHIKSNLKEKIKFKAPSFWIWNLYRAHKLLTQSYSTCGNKWNNDNKVWDLIVFWTKLSTLFMLFLLTSQFRNRPVHLLKFKFTYRSFECPLKEREKKEDQRMRTIARFQRRRLRRNV